MYSLSCKVHDPNYQHDKFDCIILTGDIYAWGVLPFHLRKKFLERAQSKIKKNLKNKANNDEVKWTLGVEFF